MKTGLTKADKEAFSKCPTGRWFYVEDMYHNRAQYRLKRLVEFDMLDWVIEGEIPHLKSKYKVKS